MMAGLDFGIARFFNSLIGRSVILDMIMTLGLLVELHSALLFPLFVWFWFHESPQQKERRVSILSSVIGILTSSLAVRAAAVLHPFVKRPVYTPELHLTWPYSVSPNALDTWSSFPSDTAAYFFAVAIALLYLDRRVGAAALTYVALFASLPRLYLGLHFLSDVLVGIGVAVAIMWLSQRPAFKALVARYCNRLFERSPALFYGILFSVAMELFTLFGPIRDPVRNAVKIWRIKSGG
jgi:membrane-associated phospholipid phosphatase